MRLNRENVRYLPGFIFPPALQIHDDLAASADGADTILVAVATAGLRVTLEQLAKTGNAKIVWACKGLEPGSAKLPHEVAEEIFSPGTECAVLSGPTFAQEVARGLPAALTLASRREGFARELAASLHIPNLRIYTSDDVVGVEVGGAVKNVMAIAAGISDGMGFGNNARAALITRGLAEMARLSLALGGRFDTVMGLTGAGDLILTCTGDMSRNRQVGLQLAAGKSLPQIITELGHAAEGVHTALELTRLIKSVDVEMPVTAAVCAVLHENLSPKVAVETLLKRELKSEHAAAPCNS